MGGQGQQGQPAIQGMGDAQVRGWVQNERVLVMGKGGCMLECFHIRDRQVQQE